MLTKSELRTAALLLKQAAASAQWVATMFFNAGEAPAAARLNDIVARLTDEENAIDAMIASAPEGHGHA